MLPAQHLSCLPPIHCKHCHSRFELINPCFTRSCCAIDIGTLGGFAGACVLVWCSCVTQLGVSSGWHHLHNNQTFEYAIWTRCIGYL